MTVVLDDKKTTVIMIPGSGDHAEQNVTIAYNDTNVDIQWLCGGHYEFTKAYLSRALESFEATQVVPEIFYKDAPNVRGRGGAFYARLIEREFKANDRIFETAMGVAWDDFKAALVEATSGKKSKKLAKFRKKS